MVCVGFLFDVDEVRAFYRNTDAPGYWLPDGRSWRRSKRWAIASERLPLLRWSVAVPVGGPFTNKTYSFIVSGCSEVGLYMFCEMHLFMERKHLGNYSKRTKVKWKTGKTMRALCNSNQFGGNCLIKWNVEISAFGKEQMFNIWIRETSN